jgi:hypothetical protein
VALLRAVLAATKPATISAIQVSFSEATLLPLKASVSRSNVTTHARQKSPVEVNKAQENLELF